MIDDNSIFTRPETIELIKQKLYFCSSELPDMARKPAHLTWIPFTLDESFFYTAFFADFGPLDLGLTMKFCQQFQQVMTTAQEQMKAVVFFTGQSEQKRANCAVLILAYMILVLNYTVEQAYGPFIGLQPAFITFRDAGFCINTFPITVLDHAKAIRKAKTLNHINYNTFSIAQYQHLQKLQNGDISWIIPGKFIAFSGPVSKRRQISPGVFTLTPEQYVPLMKSLGVTCIVRFNDKCYDRRVFLNNGIRHVDLFYEDGGNPSEGILQSFLQVCEQERGAIAVHCKAGLGRTGTNIAAYMMKHFGYTAKEATAWCRICRPGSIVGPQQQFLVSIETKMFQEGQQYRDKMKEKGLQPVSSTATLLSGITDTGDRSGRTTPSLFASSNTSNSANKKESHGNGSSGSNNSRPSSRRNSRSGQENLPINSNHNTNHSSDQLPPRAQSTSRVRPSTTSTTNPSSNKVVSPPSLHNTSSRDSQETTSLFSVSNDSRSQKSESHTTPASHSHQYETSGGSGNRPRSSSSPVTITTNNNNNPTNYGLNNTNTSSNSNSNNPYNHVRTSGQGSLSIQTPSHNNYHPHSNPNPYKGISSVPKPSSNSNNSSTNQPSSSSSWMYLNADVRRSLPTTTSTSTSKGKGYDEGYNGYGVPLSRKDSKQAWNDPTTTITTPTNNNSNNNKDTVSISSQKSNSPSPYLRDNNNKGSGSASPTSVTADVSSMKFTRHGHDHTNNSNNNYSNHSMPPIDRPRSSSTSNRSRIIAAR